MDRRKLIDHAMTYLGVPYMDEGRTRLGVDCLGLILAVARDLGLSSIEYRGYGKRPSWRMMRDELTKHTDKIPLCDISAGDLLWMKWGDQPQHLGILTHTEPLRMLHADNLLGKVVHHRLDKQWKSSIRGCYRIRLDG